MKKKRKKPSSGNRKQDQTQSVVTRNEVKKWGRSVYSGSKRRGKNPGGKGQKRDVAQKNKKPEVLSRLVSQTGKGGCRKSEMVGARKTRWKKRGK